MNSPSVQGQKGSRLIGQNVDEITGGMAEPKPAMTPPGEAQLQADVPNAASYKEVRAKNAGDLAELKRMKKTVENQQSGLLDELKLETDDVLNEYQQSMLELAGRQKYTAQRMQANSTKISGLKSTAGETKPLKVHDYVAKNKEITAIDDQVSQLQQELKDLEAGKEIQIRGRQQELAAQSTATSSDPMIPKGKRTFNDDFLDQGPAEMGMSEGQAFAAEGDSPRSAFAETEQGGTITPAYTQHATRFAEKMPLIEKAAKVKMRKVEIKSELMQLDKVRKDAAVMATRRAQEQYIIANDPAVQKALKERATLRGQTTKATKEATVLGQGQLEAKQAGKVGQHAAKYKSVLTEKLDSLGAEIMQAEEMKYYLNQKVASLGTSKNKIVREFAWTASDSDRWGMFTGGQRGYENFQQVFHELNGEAKDVFKTWFYQRLGKSLNNPETGSMSNYSKIFGSKAKPTDVIDPLILKTLMGSDDAAQDFMKIFKQVEAGSGSIWDKRFVKKAADHMAWMLPMSMVYSFSSGSAGHLAGTATAGGVALVAASWPKVFERIAKNPEFRKEMLRLLDDSAGSITARSYPSITKFLYSLGHPIEIEEDKKK